MYGLQDWIALAEEVHSLGFVTRVWKCNDQTRWKTSVKAGINMIATDKITKYNWASFGKHKFNVRYK